jgi:hypothetical protein
MKGKRKKRPGVSQAEALRTAQRVDELVEIRLDGAQWRHVRQFVSEHAAEAGSCWEVARGQQPLSDRQLRRLMARADKVIMASTRQKRRAAIRWHLARRENLYAKAVNAGDARTALAVLRDLAELKGLYPAKQTEVTFPHGMGPSPEDVEAGRARAEEYRRQRMTGAPNTNGSNRTTNGSGGR